LKPGALVSLAREAIEPGVLDGELANLIARNQVRRLLAAFGAVRSIKDLDCTTAPPCRQQFERHRAHGHVVIRARSRRFQSP
jgi:hypothetical protein